MINMHKMLLNQFQSVVSQFQKALERYKDAEDSTELILRYALFRSFSLCQMTLVMYFTSQGVTPENVEQAISDNSTLALKPYTLDKADLEYFQDLCMAHNELNMYDVDYEKDEFELIAEMPKAAAFYEKLLQSQVAMPSQKSAGEQVQM